MNSPSSGDWSSKVTRESNALDLEEGIFTWKDAKKIDQGVRLLDYKENRGQRTVFANIRNNCALTPFIAIQIAFGTRVDIHE